MLKAQKRKGGKGSRRKQSLHCAISVVYISHMYTYERQRGRCFWEDAGIPPLSCPEYTGRTSRQESKKVNICRRRDRVSGFQSRFVFVFSGLFATRMPSPQNQPRRRWQRRRVTLRQPADTLFGKRARSLPTQTPFSFRKSERNGLHSQCTCLLLTPRDRIDFHESLLDYPFFFLSSRPVPSNYEKPLQL